MELVLTLQTVPDAVSVSDAIESQHNVGRPLINQAALVDVASAMPMCHDSKHISNVTCVRTLLHAALRRVIWRAMEAAHAIAK